MIAIDDKEVVALHQFRAMAAIGDPIERKLFRGCISHLISTNRESGPDKLRWMHYYFCAYYPRYGRHLNDRLTYWIDKGEEVDEIAKFFKDYLDELIAKNYSKPLAIMDLRQEINRDLIVRGINEIV